MYTASWRHNKPLQSGLPAKGARLTVELFQDGL